AVTDPAQPVRITGPPRVRSSEPPGVMTSNATDAMLYAADVMSALARRSIGLRSPPKFHDVLAPPPTSHWNTPRLGAVTMWRTSPETLMSSADCSTPRS